ncbi:MAG TPA: hypothetical protein VF194_02350 [Ferrovibrio sp.]|uniref:hypothetical protein n=1 Tax=Ferrovibrio sp. TaxID=1917215 RepID=UPI002ED3BA30
MGKRHKGTPRKQRALFVQATTTREATEIVITIDRATGEIRFDQPMADVYLGASYDRAKGPKILSRVPQHGSPTFDVAAALRQNFDVVCAVDTNTTLSNGIKYSATGVLIVREAQNNSQTGRVDWNFDVPFCILFQGLAHPEENRGWQLALEILYARNLIKETDRVGLIVDCDLGNIPDYNNRIKPVCEAFYLPPTVQLIYASTDAGNENVANNALYWSDRVAAQCLEKANANAIPFRTQENAPFTAVAIVGVDRAEP